MQGHSAVLPFFPLSCITRLPAEICPSWQQMFCSGWFLWVVACKHSGCSCSQWCYKLPTSNPLSMVCNNVCTVASYTNTCNPSNNSKQLQNSSKFVELTYKLCLLCGICTEGKLTKQLKAHHKLQMDQSRRGCTKANKLSLSPKQRWG